jgi:hypothetical protein
MGSFDKLLKPAATAAGTAFGGPVGGALASFGSTALTGGDFGESLASGISAGGLSSIGGAGAGASGSAAAPAAAPSFGSKFMTNLGFGSDPWKNVSKGGELILSARNTMQPQANPFDLFVPAPQRPKLIDILNERSY